MSGNIQGSIASFQDTPTVVNFTTNSVLSSTSITINTPADARKDDVLVVFITASTTSSAFSASGWLRAYGSGSLTSGYARQTCLAAAIPAVIAPSYTFTTDVATNITAVMVLVRDPLNSVVAFVSPWSVTSSTTHSTPTFTTTYGGLMLCGYGFNLSSSSGMTASVPSGMAEVAYNVGSGTDVYRATFVCSQLITFGSVAARVSTTSESVQSAIGGILLYPE